VLWLCTEVSALVMHLAEGGFKIINGPPKMGKGPVSNEKELESSNEASQPQPTQAGRIETCQEAIKEAMRCLGNGDKDCVTRLIEELIKANCHDGRLIGKEIADGVRDIVHELWLVSNHEEECRLLRILRDLGVSRNWVKDTLGVNTKRLNNWLIRCSIDLKGRAKRSEVVKRIEDLLRRLGWSEVKMCEEMFRFININVDEFRRRGIEPCSWLGLKSLRDLRRPYWLGLKDSDLVIGKYKMKVKLTLNTTNAIDAIFFLTLLNAVKALSLEIVWIKMPAAKYVYMPIALSYYVYLDIDEWPWPIELSAYELEKTLNGFNDEELSEYIAGKIDGDGSILVSKDKEGCLRAIVRITACKGCPKRTNLDVLKEMIAKRFGIIGHINPTAEKINLVFNGESAIRLLRRIMKYIHHPLRRLRAELILAYYEGRIDRGTFEKLYKMTEYEYGGPDVKRNNALEATIQAAPQTRTHGGIKHKPKN